jgi:hypothetical protein
MSLRIQPSFGADSYAHQRIEARARVALQAVVETVLGRSRGFILNLSCHGAMVQTERVLTRGVDLLLKCRQLDALGRVMWARDGLCGVEFDEPIEEELVIELRQVADEIARRARHQLTSRPGLAIRRLTPEEQALADEWATSGGFW